ncbi:MAG: C_GCAxxG_C_C family protein [Syntrophaceae bacterium]|nr:C_GCAxxG_C_C family protein [Syntrophaceae bacterium]
MATLEVFQDIIGRQENCFLKAATGLEGGVTACGSTCGVVTGGSLGLALMYDSILQEKGIPAEAGVISLVGEYVRWFGNNFGSPLCKERTGVNFYSAKGQLRYLFPGDKVSKCMWHIRGAMRHLYDYQGKDLPGINIGLNDKKSEPIHCAQSVLQGIRNRTGVGDPILERMSFVLDGGIGFQGGVCGALVGAIMGINILLGINIREMNYLQIMKLFIIGHMNLILNKDSKKPDPFYVGKKIVEKFKKEATFTECRDITEKKFSDWADFQKHISSSNKCSKLIELATTEASNAIQKFL